MKEETFSIKGMHCASCEILIERALKKVPGVQKVAVDRAHETAHVCCTEEFPVMVSHLQDAVASAGYTLHQMQNQSQDSESDDVNESNESGEPNETDESDPIPQEGHHLKHHPTIPQNQDQNSHQNNHKNNHQNTSPQDARILARHEIRR